MIMKYLVIFALLAVGSSAQMTGVNSTEIVGVLKENIDLLEVSFKSVLAELRTQNDQYAWTLREIIIAFEGAIREFPTSNLTITQKTWLTSVQKFSERFGLFGAEYIENYLKINQFKPSPVVQQSMFNYGINIRQVNDQVRATLSGFVEAVYSFDIRFKASIKERYASIEKAIEDLVNYTHKIINGLDICIDSTEIRNCVAFLMEGNDAFQIIGLIGKISTFTKSANVQLQNDYNNIRNELPVLKI